MRGEDPRHLVAGLPGAVELRELPRRCATAPRLALPVPGDPWAWAAPRLQPRGARGGEAVVLGAVGLVPSSTPARSSGGPTTSGRCPTSTSAETAIELRTALVEVTGRLVELDVASWQPEIPDLLMNLRRRPRLPLPPGMTPRRSRRSTGRCCASRSSRLAVDEDGGAVSAYEISQRRAALADLDRAARRALVGACSGRR